MSLPLEVMVIAAAVSIAISSVVLGSFSQETASRYTGALGYAAGFLSAFAYLESHALSPTLPWHWLPWLALIGGVIGPIAIASGVRPLERWVLSAIFSLAAAWLLVPTQRALQPMRTPYMLAFAGSLAVFWNLLDRLSRKESGIPLCVALAATSLSGAALVAYEFSVRIGFLSAVGAAALAGGGLSAAWKRDFTIVRGMLGAQSVVLCGVLLTAQLGDGLAIPLLTLILLAPLTLWVFEVGPLATLQGYRAALTKAFAVGLPHLAAWSFVLVRDYGSQ